jgi:hypothetical protein
VLSTGKNWPNRKAHVRCFYPADHMQRPAEEFSHDHNFLHAPCDYRFAVSPQGTCTKKEHYPCDLLALVASLKWRVRGEKWHPNNFRTRTCVSLSTCVPRVKWVQLKGIEKVRFYTSLCQESLLLSRQSVRRLLCPFSSSPRLKTRKVFSLGYSG